MRRITQILASIAFVITVVTAYLAFDFAINNALTHRNSPAKLTHEHDHHDINFRNNEPAPDIQLKYDNANDEDHDSIKISKKRSLLLTTLSHVKRSNRTVKQHDDHDQRLEHHRSNNESHKRIAKSKSVPPALRAKPGNFHKGKTGVKVNKPRKLAKLQRKNSTTITTKHNKDKRNMADRKHNH